MSSFSVENISHSVQGFLSEYLLQVLSRGFSCNPKKIPLCWSETEEEEKADQEDEGDGAADVGDGSHGRDGDGHGLLGCLHGEQGEQSDPAEQSLGEGRD